MVMRTIAATAVLVLAATAISSAADVKDDVFANLGTEFTKQAQPVLKKYCYECHSAEVQEAELNLAAFESIADVRRGAQAWQKVGTMLDTRQMPPPEAEQPTDEERAELHQWVQRYLKEEASSTAGDPGRVVLRRLNNSEYTYTLRDLTGIDLLEPAREFPVDGAAGEGFTNTGAALVMSPSLLTKYLDAGKEIAGHAVMLPGGIRFSSKTTARDWTDEVLAEIRKFYAQFSDGGGATQVNIQGIVFGTNEGGRMPVERYLAATLAERDALSSGKKSIEAVASEKQLNAKYLRILWDTLTSSEPSLILDDIRGRWRQSKVEEATALAARINQWQAALWRFTTVGHIGKVGGPKSWMEAVNPLVSRQEIRFKIPASESGSDVVLYLSASDAGDGNDRDFVVWEQPRLVAPGRPDLLLRDVRSVSQQLVARRKQILAKTADYLAAADEARRAQGNFKPAAIAQRHKLETDALIAWLDYLGIGTGNAEVKIDSYFTQQMKGVAGYEFVNGWGSDATPQIVANSSDQHVRIPGNMAAHGVVVHPSPTLQTATGWKSPVTGSFRISGTVQHAHPECGNGVTWTLELRRGATRQQLAKGDSQGATIVPVGPIENLAIQRGDVVSLLVGPRDGNHACDLTAVNLIAATADREWNLARDISPNILAANPHADTFGNKDVWHLYTEPLSVHSGPIIPADSALAKWNAATDANEKLNLAAAMQTLLTGDAPSEAGSPDGVLYRQLTSLGGPLMSAVRAAEKDTPTAKASNPKEPSWGLDVARFGVHPNGNRLDSTNLYVRAPSLIEVRLPADLVEGCEFVAAASLHASGTDQGTVQLQVGAANPGENTGINPTVPILAAEKAQQRVLAALDAFRDVFPAALCYTKIVPVDEAVTLTLFYREDDALKRLMLDEQQATELDRLWNELHFVSQDALTLVDAFEQLLEYASQDSDPKMFEPMRDSIYGSASAFREAQIAAEPVHLQAVLDLAGRAYRRPLTDAESDELRSLYRELRTQEIPHDEAIRLTLARVFVSPAFLYRFEQPGPGTERGQISDWELATRLSYFLWSSLPDEKLLAKAAAGELKQPDTLRAQAQRMLKDARVRRMAMEFGCQWLHIRDFDQHNEKSEGHFPTFTALRDEMYEESIQFFTDLFQNDGSVLAIVDADYTFLNEELAKHYGVPNVSGPEWRKIEGVKQFSRGGILTQSTTLAMQSGASRTSPILRGNWISETLLGERLPRPPKDVPQLPDTVPEGLTERQLIEMHSSHAACAKCHSRIDPFGFALENFDAIGRYRANSPDGKPLDTKSKTLDGVDLEGLEGLQRYLLTTRRDDFLRQFCKKLLGYALGRGVQLSDEPLLAEMQRRLEANDYHVSAAVEAIVTSEQFRMIRGQEAGE